MIVSKDDFFNGLDFNGLIKSKKLNASDISISIQSKDGVPYVANFIFRNGIEKMIGDIDRIMFARFKNRIIFKMDEDGVKLCSSGSRDNLYAKFYLKDKNSYIQLFAGDYDLRFDDLYEYYYIEKGDLK